ncbi:hypothetical protein SAMN02745225_01875 [Ferrithrix thermotolerans DSM 19514]|uniref:Uncharacterized protein n=1 Tax=Ferrithrix thermotolerans DSM 19514 TaxID=1121881 RepID=A0A1M4X2P9_9ACTN|nr:hypothetical protein [Ferrithrix thermotolerans]SHE87736.1 hypothetical protein SAMN02745225_01875 [Ferrithrix thermotolerans DSM 19514]
MISKLALLLIVFAWVTVVVVPAINRWRTQQQVSSVARFADQLHVLEKQCTRTSINFSFTLTKTQEVTSAATFSHNHHPSRVSPLCYRRRRRTFASLIGITVGSLLLTPVASTVGILSVMLSVALLSTYVVALRRSKLRSLDTNRLGQGQTSSTSVRALGYS